MSLVKYQTKRHFQKTPEPKGAVLPKEKAIFVVQEHHARNLHYDFRLATAGVLKSWAIPKKPPQKAGLKRLAMQVEDHPLAYAKFKGKIPAGEYGAGSVKIWDQGCYRTIRQDQRAWEFTLNGQKLKGHYVLLKFPRAGEKAWLFWKKKAVKN